MLFKDLLDEKLEKLRPVFGNLLQLALDNQVHNGDLLLISLNGFYYPEVHSWDNLEKKMSPYMFGPSNEGHAAFTHGDYITNYFENNTCKILKSEYENYLKEIRQNDLALFDKIIDMDAISIQNEMLIYLKIWEADFFIKKLYQLANLINGKAYDWHFKITTTGVKTKGIGNRSKIIREKIRDKFKNKSPILYNSLLNSYNTQFRNAIAHSQYFINGNIILNNHNPTDEFNKIRSLTRKEWTDRFHESLAIYMHTNKLMKDVERIYVECSKQNQNKVEIKINRTDPKVEEEFKILFYSPSSNKWSWDKIN